MPPILFKLHKTVVIAFRCLWQQKLRSVLSILGVICGVITVLIMLGAGEGAKQKILTRIERLGTQNIYIQAVSLNPEQAARAAQQRSRGLRMADAAGIRKSCREAIQVAGLKEIEAAIIGASAGISPRIVAASASYDDILNLRVQSGRFFTRVDVDEKNLVCVLGHTVSRRLGAKGKPGQRIRIQNHVFHVVGVLAGMDPVSDEQSAIAIRDFNNMVFLPMGTERFIDTHGRNHAGVGNTPSFSGENDSALSEIIVQMQHSEVVPQAALTIRRIMDVRHHHAEDFQIVVPVELLNQSRQTQRTLNMMLAAIAGVSLVVGGIGIMNIMLATVSERTREIGIRRAVGATRMDIVFQFLAEAMILTFSGGVIGVLLGTAGVRFAAGIGDWRIILTPWAIVLPLGMAVLVGITFGLYPACRAAKMNPATAFRHE